MPRLSSLSSTSAPYQQVNQAQAVTASHLAGIKLSSTVPVDIVPVDIVPADSGGSHLSKPTDTTYLSNISYPVGQGFDTGVVSKITGSHEGYKGCIWFDIGYQKTLDIVFPPEETLDTALGKISLGDYKAQIVSSKSQKEICYIGPKVGLKGGGLSGSYRFFDSKQAKLCTASINANIKDIDDLILRGADVNAVNKHGGTPLIYAIRYRHVEVAKLLLDKGADPNKANHHGDRPLHHAVHNGDVELIQFLLNKGANVNKVNRYGNTLLHDAVNSGDVKFVKFLLNKGAHVNKANKFGETPLDFAANNGDADVLEALELFDKASKQ